MHPLRMITLVLASAILSVLTANAVLIAFHPMIGELESLAIDFESWLISFWRF